MLTLAAAAALTLAPAHLEALVADRDVLTPVYEGSTLATEMLAQVNRLPPGHSGRFYAAFRPNEAITADAYEALGEDEQARYQEITFGPADTYDTFYGTPLVYVHVLDLYEQHSGERSIDGAKILDLGYGQIGQLRLWAQMGADVTGVEVDPVLTALYDDSPLVGDADGDPDTPGSVTLIEGAYPQDGDTREAVGESYDLIVSRNLLKRGYVKPEKTTPGFPEPVAWGMTDDEAPAAFYDTLAPGGYLIIESLGPAPDPEKPWSDISNPWDRAAWERAGFEALAHDEDESHFVREQGRALGWDAQMDLDEGLYSVYSVYKKPE